MDLVVFMPLHLQQIPHAFALKDNIPSAVVTLSTLTPQLRVCKETDRCGWRGEGLCCVAFILLCTSNVSVDTLISSLSSRLPLLYPHYPLYLSQMGPQANASYSVLPRPSEWSSPFIKGPVRVLSVTGRQTIVTVSHSTQKTRTHLSNLITG